MNAVSAPVLPAALVAEPVVPDGTSFVPPSLGDPPVDGLVVALAPVPLEPSFVDEPVDVAALAAELTVADDAAGQPSRRSAAYSLRADRSVASSPRTVDCAPSNVDAPFGAASARALASVC
jgi:hypothetical protein